MTADQFIDQVPATVRQSYSRQGWYPDTDLYTLFTRRVGETPDRTALIDDDGPITYSELDDLARRIACGLTNIGVHPGDVVGVQLPNHRLCCALDLAIAALGAVALPYPVGR